MSAFIQGVGTTTAQSINPFTLQFTTQNTAAGSLIVAVTRTNGTITLQSVTDDQSNSYTVIDLGNIPNSGHAAFAYALNTHGGTKANLQFTFSSAVAGGVAAIAEYAGSAAAAFHTSGTIGANTGTNPTTGNITPSVGDLLIASLSGDQGFTTASLSAGTCGALAALRNGGTVTSTTFAIFEDGVANSASAQASTFTYSTSTSYVAQTFAFSSSSGASGSNSSWLTINANNALRGLRH